jgi:hypothetical protein
MSALSLSRAPLSSLCADALRQVEQVMEQRERLVAEKSGATADLDAMRRNNAQLSDIIRQREVTRRPARLGSARLRLSLTPAASHRADRARQAADRNSGGAPRCGPRRVG